METCFGHTQLERRLRRIFFRTPRGCEQLARLISYLGLEARVAGFDKVAFGFAVFALEADFVILHVVIVARIDDCLRICPP
ncbi:Protein of unknown function [Gryllus bimaculatus]|nr:Protein of unknown function [Gryllus bimaculatus]